MPLWPGNILQFSQEVSEHVAEKRNIWASRLNTSIYCLCNLTLDLQLKMYGCFISLTRIIDVRSSKSLLLRFRQVFTEFSSVAGVAYQSDYSTVFGRFVTIWVMLWQKVFSTVNFMCLDINGFFVCQCYHSVSCLQEHPYIYTRPQRKSLGYTYKWVQSGVTDIQFFLNTNVKASILWF